MSHLQESRSKTTRYTPDYGANRSSEVLKLDLSGLPTHQAQWIVKWRGNPLFVTVPQEKVIDGIF